VSVFAASYVALPQVKATAMGAMGAKEDAKEFSFATDGNQMDADETSFAQWREVDNFDLPCRIL
jgi:hypothetical protein